MRLSVFRDLWNRFARMVLVLAAMSALPEIAHAQPAAGWNVEGGYWMSGVSQGGDVVVEWRRFSDGAPNNDIFEVDTETVALRQGDRILNPNGLRAPTAQNKAHTLVVLDTSDSDALFDQLAAIRALLGVADFDQQDWSFFIAGGASAPIAEIRSEAELAVAWGVLRGVLNESPIADPNPVGADDRALFAEPMRHLASVAGTRKALIFPESLGGELADRLNEQSVQALLSNGISLFPLIDGDSEQERAAYVLIAGSTGGKVLPWLETPPDPILASLAFEDLLGGQILRFEGLRAFRFPWEETADLEIVLFNGTQPRASLSLIGATPLASGSQWMSLISPVSWVQWSLSTDRRWLGGSLLLIALLMAGALFGLHRRRSGSPNSDHATTRSASVFDRFKRSKSVRFLSMGRISSSMLELDYPIDKYPLTVGKSPRADVTIANNLLDEIHLRIRMTKTGALKIQVVGIRGTTLIDGARVTQAVMETETAVVVSGLQFTITPPQREQEVQPVLPVEVVDPKAN